MKYSVAYHNAHELQKAMFEKALVVQDGAVQTAFVKAWLDLEWFKRELRGLPRLKAAELLNTLKRLPNAQRPAAATPIEITTEPEVSKESLKNAFSETVTAPPAG